MDSSVVFMKPQPVRMELQYQSCPFQVELKPTSAQLKQNLESGVSVVISSQKPYWFASFWGSDITAFHQTVALHWKDLRKDMEEGNLFKG